jgi:hypothetical protein
MERAGVVAPLVLVAGLALGLVELLLWPVHGGPGQGPPGGPTPPPVWVVETFVLFSAVNVALLLALVVVYGRTFAQTRAQFALGLVAFLVVLLFEAIASSPFVYAVFGLGPGTLGPFLLLGAILESVALGIFLVLSLE